MAEQAQKEPTMEEILSSIRKIIADEDQPVAEAVKADPEPSFAVNDSDDDVFGDLDLTAEEDFVDTVPETTDDVLAAINDSMTEASEVLEAEEEFVSEEVDFSDDVADLDEMLDLDQFDDAQTFETETFVEETVMDFDEPAFEEPAPEPAAFAPEPEFEPETIEPDPTPEPVMSHAAPIADIATADAAAGSLGKLLSKVEFGDEAGGNNTIDGVVKALLRPMLKEWLDDNLPAIVEKHVEAEVQRIARMAR
jgi:cell pole-organizing protein PopZ